MSRYDINYKTEGKELMPPNKRDVFNMGFIDAFMSAIQFIRDKFLGDYRAGSSYPIWIGGVGYLIGQRVTHKQIVYENLVQYNYEEPPLASWVEVLPCFIGVDTRIKFNGQRLVLEYALNTRFNTSFRQPPLQSDIYIGKNGVSLTGFLVGQTIGSTVAQNDIAYYPQWVAGIYNQYDLVVYKGLLYLSLTGLNNTTIPSNFWHPTDVVGVPSIFQRISNFTIYIPSAVYATISEMEVRQYVDPLIPAGLFYTIETY